MNIPKRLRIGAHMVDVVVTSTCDQVNYDEIGKTILAKDIIYINETYPQSRQEEALVHEIVHNLLFDIGVVDDERHSEEFVTAFSAALYRMIRDNPRMFGGEADEPKRS